MLERTGPEEGSDSEFWIQLEAQLFTTGIGAALEDESAEKDTRERASAINERVRGWAYRIPQYKYNAMSRRMEDLLKVNPEA